jgi:predicted SAM-dependent methyltransferase
MIAKLPILTRRIVKQILPPRFIARYRKTFSPIVFSIAIYVGKLRRLVVRPVLPVVEGDQRYLHLGCGAVNNPLFINVDIVPRPHVHYVRKIDNLGPFDDRTVDLVYACHCLEHYAHAHVLDVLIEWCRVLKPGGRLRLSVPDFDVLTTVYLENGRQISPLLAPLLGGQNDAFDYHKAAFNMGYLSELLLEAGFSHVCSWTPERSDPLFMNDYSSAVLRCGSKAYAISLNLEAFK